MSRLPSFVHAPRRTGARLALWAAVAALSVVVDFVAGPRVQFPAIYVLPVLLAAWYDRLWHAVVLAVLLSLARFSFTRFGAWAVPSDLGYAIANAGIRIAVLWGLGYLTTRVAREHRATQERVRMLERMLPICSYCKEIRDAGGRWSRLETYFGEHEDISFTHGICPSCLREHHPELVE